MKTFIPMPHEVAAAFIHSIISVLVIGKYKTLQTTITRATVCSMTPLIYGLQIFPLCLKLVTQDH